MDFDVTDTLKTVIKEADEYVKKQCRPRSGLGDLLYTQNNRLAIPKFNLDDSAASSSSMFSSAGKSDTSHPNLKRKLNEKEAELHYVHALNEQLKSNISHKEPEAMKKVIELEKDLEITKEKLKSEKCQSSMLMEKLKKFENYESHSRESFYEIREQMDIKIKKLTARLQAALKKISCLEEELQEEKCAKLSLSKAYETEIMQLKSDVIVTEDHLKSQKEQFKIMSRRMQENFDAELKRLNNLHKIEVDHLKQRLIEQEESEIFVNSMKTNIKQLIEFEKEVLNLREQNKILKGNQDNVLLLTEKIKTLQEQLNKEHHTKDEITKISIENQLLKNSLSQWESLAKSQGDSCSPSAVSGRLAYLQTMQLALNEELGQHKTEIKVAKVNQSRAENESQALKIELEQVKKNLETINLCARKLKNRQLLLSKECESYRRLISSYENEVTLDLGIVNKERVNTLENLLEEYKSLIEELTKTNDSGSHKILSEERTKLKAENAELIKQVDSLQALNSELINNANMKDHAPDYRVYHFKDNPVNWAEEKRKNELKLLRDENEKLKLKIKVIMEKGDISNITIENTMNVNDTEKVKALQEQLQSSEQKNKRMMEAFKRSSSEFREISYLLTGFRIDIIAPKMYKLTHVFADTPQDHLLFGSAEPGKLQLLETEYSKTLLPLIEDYLGRQNCIPAFLSTLTLDLYSKQTICVSSFTNSGTI